MLVNSKQQQLRHTLIGHDAVMLVRKIMNKPSRQINDGIDHFWSVGLNYEEKTLYVDHILTGPPTEITIHDLRRIFRIAVEKRTASIVLCHYQESESDSCPRLTPEHINFTYKVSHTGRVLGISVLDHVLFTRNRYSSFKELGLTSALYFCKDRVYRSAWTQPRKGPAINQREKEKDHDASKGF